MMRQDYLPFGRPNFSDEEIEAVTRVMRSSWVGMGSETIAFERELADYLEVPYVVTVSSCTAGLFLSLLVQGIQPGDEVICPSLTWYSTADVAVHLGAKPVFCDVDPHTLCVTPELIQEKLTDKTKAVIVVHYGGLAIDVEKIRGILPENVVLIEDAAHAIGSRYSNGKLVGASENLTCFSFYANKNLSTADGGAVALFDRELAERIATIRLHGMPIDAWKRYKSSKNKSVVFTQAIEIGYKMNFTDLLASIGRIQLRRQKEFHKIRLDIAQYYAENLPSIDLGIKLQENILDPDHARHLFVIQLPIETMKLSRDEILMTLRQRNVGASIHYRPLHLQGIYEEQPPLSTTEKLFEKIMTLPLSSSMSVEDAKYVIEQLKDIVNNS